MAESSLSSKQVTALIILAALGGFVMGQLTTDLRRVFARPGGPGAPVALDSEEFLQESPGEPAEDSDLLPVAGAPFLGPAAAKVTIVEFSDFQCPYCSRAADTVHELLDGYGDDIRLVFRNLPLPFHENAVPAAHAALAAHEQGRFWAFHDALFANQQALDGDSLNSYADNLDLDMEAFESAMASEATQAIVEADLALASRLGFNGTPSFSINGIEVVGAQPAAAFRQVIDAEISAAEELLESGVPISEVYRRRLEANLGGGDEEPSVPSAVIWPPERPEPTRMAARIPSDGPVEITIITRPDDAEGAAFVASIEALRDDFGDRLIVAVRTVDELSPEESERIVVTPVTTVAGRRYIGLVSLEDVRVAVESALGL
jgi:protein-disulfide isomerase